MEWIKIEKNNLPKGEVLAANFVSGTYGYMEKLIGYLSIKENSSSEVIKCEDEHQVLNNCTHYIDIHNFDIE